MRVCLITEYFYPDSTGGTPAVLSELTRHLVDTYQDISVSVITSRNSYRDDNIRYSQFEDWNGVHIHRVSCPRSNRPSLVLRLLAGALFSVVAGFVAVKGNYDLVFVGTNPPSAPIAARIVSALRKTAYVYLIHDLFPDVMFRLSGLKKANKIVAIAERFQSKWLNGAKKVVVLGRCMAEYLQTKYQVPESSLEVISNWADPDVIRPLPKDTHFRRNNGLTGFVVLYAGNFGLYQDFDAILDAAKILQDKQVRATIVFVGDGAKNDYILERIEELKLGNFKVLPFVPVKEFPDLLASSDVSLVTLEPGMEGLGVPSKFYNILASGRPTLAIVDPSSEVARVLEEHACGVRIDQLDSNGIADAIIRLMQSEDDLQTMGMNARKAFCDNYTLKHAAGKYYQLFNQVIR